MCKSEAPCHKIIVENWRKWILSRNKFTLKINKKRNKAYLDSAALSFYGTRLKIEYLYWCASFGICTWSLCCWDCYTQPCLLHTRASYCLYCLYCYWWICMLPEPTWIFCSAFCLAWSPLSCAASFSGIWSKLSCPFLRAGWTHLKNAFRRF